MTEQEMPRYQCHKKVRAMKIGSIEHKPNPDQSGKTGSSSYGAIIHPDDKKYAAFDVSAEYICKHRPITLSMRMDMNHILLLRYLSLDIQNYRNPL